VKKLPFLLHFLLLLTSAHSQQNYWQQEVNYTIEVSLNDKDNTLNGFEKIEYVNNSPDTLRFIWFHIWPNAYKNDKTAFSDQLLENGNTKFYFSGKEQKGYINRLDFKVNNITAATEDHPQHIDIIKLVLPLPLLPHEKVLITTPFHVKLPFNFSRGGYDGQSYQVTQWYPKPAVYDRKGWHPMPYLDQGEFYSEFGSFDVSITVPNNYVVAATGELQNAEEKKWLESRSSFSWKPVKKKIKTKGGGYKTIYDPFPPSSSNIKILRFKQSNVHDFAWFADKRFIVAHDTCSLQSGKIIEAFAYYTPEQEIYWKHVIQTVKNTIRFYSQQVGEYPYNVVSAVQGPASFGGGMEYPTITVISADDNQRELTKTVFHEVGHNWFYGILGTNERDYPWMDEGINTFYEDKYFAPKDQWLNFDKEGEFQIKATEKTDQPINTASEKFNADNYDLVAYYKTAQWLRYMESQLDSQVFRKAIQDYYQRWQFKHPQPDDFKNTISESSGRNVDSLFSYLDKKGSLPNQQREKGTEFIPGLTGDVLMHPSLPSKSYFLFSPYAFGYNKYDGFKLGVLFTNMRITRPTIPSPFEFLLVPQYAFGSKRVTGSGLVRYNLFKVGFFRRITVGVNGSTFSMDKYTDEKNNTTRFQVIKVVPNIRLTLSQKNPRSTMNRYIQFKTYLFAEDGLRFYSDTIHNPPAPDTVVFKYNKTKENSVVNQLLLVAENYRVLYPYRGELKIEQAKDFVRAAFTGNYFFNYPKGSGLDLRIFAGKFFYLGSKTFTKQFNTDRYHLNMTGANGYEDYTYSDYFIGRNEFEGATSQQIMIRDGAFKVRTDLLAEKVGKTDDWLITMNLTSGMPGLNPFRSLPESFPIKLKVFADIGTYAEPWKKNSTGDKFLFDAGLQLSLFKTVHIYFPLVYSKVFKDYIQSTLPKKNRFLKVMSFAVDISNFSFRRLGLKHEY